MTAVLVASAGLFGLCIGSFLNVVIYRVPRELSIVAPPSSCPHCHARIRTIDNIPLLSWVFLRGRCRDCTSRISIRYPLVELSTALLFVGAALRLGHDWALPAYCALLAGILALGLIDLEHLRLPRKMVWIHLLIVVLLFTGAAGLAHEWRRLEIGAVCSLVWSGVFYLINFMSPRLMGFGDVRLALVLGLSLGWLGVGHAMLAFFVANFVGLIVSIGLILAKKMSADQPVPYGVYLAAGTALVFFFGTHVLTPLNVH